MVQLAGFDPLAKLRESLFDIANRQLSGANRVLDRRQQMHPRGDDRERITRARQAAEALFTPRPQLTEQSVPEPLAAADHPARKPRILAVSPATSSDREAVETPVSLKRQAVRGITVSHFERIRTWVKYGMTVPQVAQFYGVAVDEIKRILRKV
jgi:hypothetical protein